VRTAQRAYFFRFCFTTRVHIVPFIYQLDRHSANEQFQVTWITAPLVRLQFDENPKEGSSRSHNFQPGISGKFKWLAIPMTTKRPRKLIRMAILPARKPFAIVRPCPSSKIFPPAGKLAARFLRQLALH
jgi:hypothetical protein